MEVSILQPISIALSLAGLSKDRSARAWIEWAATEGLRGVTLDASAPGLRARELDRSARRELTALLRRRELAFVGLDLWIPPKDFLAPEKVDRAVSAALGTIELAGELGTLVGAAKPIVSMLFPAQIDPRTIEPMLESAIRHGTIVADHRWPIPTDDVTTNSTLGVGLDPATLLLSGAAPAAELIGVGDRLRCVRLSDADATGRTMVGEGELDVNAFRTALMAAHHTAPIVLDVRGVADGEKAVRRGLERWNQCNW